MTRAAALATVGAWILDRSGPVVLALLILCALIGYPLGRVSPGLPSGLGFAAYVVWLLLVSVRLRPSARRWSRTSLLWAPFLVLFVHALVVTPLLLDPRFSGSIEALGPVLAAVAALAYLVIWENIAWSISRGRRTRLARGGWHIGLWLVSLMPPFAVLWAQHGLQASTRSSAS